MCSFFHTVQQLQVQLAGNQTNDGSSGAISQIIQLPVSSASNVSGTSPIVSQLMIPSGTNNESPMSAISVSIFFLFILYLYVALWYLILIADSRAATSYSAAIKQVHQLSGSDCWRESNISVPASRHRRWSTNCLCWNFWRDGRRID